MKHSGGFTVNVTYTAAGHIDEMEDILEGFKESMESQPDYVGRWLDVQRDGKTVWASETQNFYNYYQSGYTFYTNEYVAVGVTSYYLTLEEIEPIFNSIMN